jgi:hypothetical protein
MRATVKQYLPTWRTNGVRNGAEQQEMDFNIMAFRAYMISKMNRILAEDAKSLA